MTLEHSECRNFLLAALPQEEFQRVAPELEHVDLPRAFDLAQAGQPLAYS